jgi:hypothetical protein
LASAGIAAAVLAGCQGADDLVDRAEVDGRPESRVAFEAIKAAVLDDQQGFATRVAGSATFSARGRAARALRREDLDRFWHCSLKTVASKSAGTADAIWDCVPDDANAAASRSVYRFALDHDQVARVVELP